MSKQADIAAELKTANDVLTAIAAEIPAINTAVTNLQKSVATLTAEIANADVTPELQAAADQVVATGNALKTSVDALNAAANPPAPPA